MERELAYTLGNGTLSESEPRRRAFRSRLQGVLEDRKHDPGNLDRAYLR